jgi:tetratricopeptide (TPR) repeat protein
LPPAPPVVSFDARLENEEQVLDGLVAALGRGALAPDVWDRLRAAAERDGRLGEVASAFESAAQGPRIRTLKPSVAAEFFFQAGRYLADVLGDEPGAAGHLERCLALAPGHAAAFARLEAMHQKSGQRAKLAELLAAGAPHRARGEQALLLRRAADLLAGENGARDRAIDLWQQVLRLEPGDEEARAKLEALYLEAGRFRDVVRMNEQWLAREPPPDDALKKVLLERVVDLYAEKIDEPARAMAHVERLLALDPKHEGARRVAEKLVNVRGLAGRAAAALATALESNGPPRELARYLALELESAHGARRAALLGRLGRLRQDRMGDDAGALEAYDQALALDPDDDDVRARYLVVAARLGRHADAARTLARVVSTARDASVKARASVQLGEALLQAGDAKRAKTALSGVLGAADAPAEVILAAARALRDLHEAAGDSRSLCNVLERIAELDPDPELRRDADERLAALAVKLRDTPRAVEAYRRLLATSSRPAALEALAALYRASGQREEYAAVLDEQAQDAGDPEQARALMLHAAEVRARQTKDAPAAIATCRAILQRFGPARDVLALLVPLLEAEGLWEEHALALAREAELTPLSTRPPVLARLGATRLDRLEDVEGAIEAFAEALSVDRRERVAREGLERLVASGEHRLAAARVLEPIYRSEGGIGALLGALDLRATLSGDVDDRLAALEEASDLATAAGASDAPRAAQFVERGLAEAAAGGRPVAPWLERLERLDQLAGGSKDLARRAAVLAHAVGDREVTTPEQSGLVQKAAEAHVAAGDVRAALRLYRRALAFEPHSRQLLYRIGALEQHHVGDLSAAIATYRAALDADPDDGQASAALEELYGRSGRWEELCALLEARIARLPAPEGRDLRAKIASIAAAHGQDERARAQAARLLEDEDLPLEHLDLAARLLAPGDPEAAASALARLGDARRAAGDLDGALEAALRAARGAPAVPEGWDRAEELARELKRPDGVAAASEDALSGELPREAALALAERAVPFYDEWFEDTAGVCRILGRVLAIDPDADWAFDRLKLVYDAAGRWDELFQLYDGAIARANGDRRRLLLEDAAQAAKDFADRPERAIQYLEALRALRPADAKIAAALERLYERQGRHRDLIALLSERLPALRADEAQRTRTRIASRWLEIGDPTAAFAALEPLVAPDAAPEVWGLLESIMASPETVRLRAAAPLRERYAALGDDAGLARALVVELEAITSPKERGARHLEIADLYDRLGDAPSALEQVGAAVVLAPNDEALRARLGELAERTGRYARLAELLESAAASAKKQAVRVRLKSQAADLRSTRLDDASGAIALLASILEEADLPAADALAATRSLEPLLEAAGRAEEQLAVAERRAALEDDRGARAEALGRAARLATQLGQRDRAIRLWNARLQGDERDAEALDALVDRLGEAGDAAGLVTVLEARARIAPDAGRRRADRVRAAALLAGDLDRPEDAIARWRAIEREHGAADDAVLALAGLFRRTRRGDDLAGILDRLLAVLRASADWRSILEITAETTRAIAATARARGEVPAEVLEALEHTAGEEADAAPWQAAARALGEAVATSGLQGAPARDVYARLGEWYRDRRRDPAQAEAWLERALAHDPASPALLGALADLRRAAPGEALTETLVRLSRATGGAPPLLREAAETARDRLGDRPRARSIAEEGLEVARARWSAPAGGEDIPAFALWAIDFLAGLSEADADPRGTLEVLHAADALPFDRPVRLAMRRRAAAVALDAVGDRAGGMALLESILADDPRDAASAERLAAVCAEAGRWDRHRDVLAEQAALAQDDGDAPRAARLWGRAAVVAEEHLGDPAGAVALHERVVALEAAPASLDALARLASARGDHAAAARWLEQLAAVCAPGQLAAIDERLAAALRALQDWARLAALTADSASRAPDDRARVARLNEAAALYAERCRQPELAVPLLEQATKLVPDDQGLRLALAEAMSQAGKFDDARALLQAMLDAFGARRPRERAPVHYQMARVELARGKRPRAVLELDAAARIDPQSPQILRMLAELAREDGQLDRAERSYRALLAALRRRDDGATAFEISRCEVLLELSAIADRQGQSERARELVESALEAADQDGRRSPALLYRLAEMQLSSAASLDAGLEALRAALEAEPQLDRAEAAVRRALQVDPTHAGLLALCERIGRQPGHQAALVEGLRLRAMLPGASFDDLREAVETARRAREDAGAAGLLQRFVEREESRGGDPAHLAWALTELAELREASGDARASLDLKRRAARFAEPDVARRLELDAARIAAGPAADPALAAELYEALHKSDPADREAWGPLAGVYKSLGDARRLCDLLASVVDYVEDASERARLRLERVRAMMSGLGLSDPDAAGMLREILDEDPNQVDGAVMLSEILERSGERDELGALLARQIDAAKDRGDGRAVATLALRLGALLRDRERIEARNVYYTGLDWEPRSAELMDALLELLDHEDDAAERADVLERRLTLEEGGEGGAIALAIALELLEARRALGDEGDLERALDLGLRVCPGSSALRERLAESRAARAMRRASGGDAAGARADLEQALSLGRGPAFRALDPAVARSLLLDAADRDPNDRSALQALAALEAGGEQWDAAVDAVVRLLALEEGPVTVEGVLGRPADDEGTGLLAEACASLGRAPEGLALIERALAEQKGRRTRESAGLHFHRSRIARLQGDVEAEVRDLVQALEGGSQTGWLCAAVAERALELGSADLANRALRAVTLLKTPGPMSRATAYRHMGELAWRAGDPKRGLTLLKRAVSEDPSVEGAADLIATIERGAAQ